MYYSLTEDDKAFLTEVIRSNQPLTLGDVLSWIHVARDYKCGLREANHELIRIQPMILDVIAKAARGIIVVDRGSKDLT